jgi:hypothetical protein
MIHLKPRANVFSEHRAHHDHRFPTMASHVPDCKAHHYDAVHRPADLIDSFSPPLAKRDNLTPPSKHVPTCAVLWPPPSHTKPSRCHRAAFDNQNHRLRPLRTTITTVITTHLLLTTIHISAKPSSPHRHRNRRHTLTATGSTQQGCLSKPLLVQRSSLLALHVASSLIRARGTTPCEIVINPSSMIRSLVPPSLPPSLSSIPACLCGLFSPPSRLVSSRLVSPAVHEATQPRARSTPQAARLGLVPREREHTSLKQRCMHLPVTS